MSIEHFGSRMIMQLDDFWPVADALHWAHIATTAVLRR